jgi:hypothetical protein
VSVARELAPDPAEPPRAHAVSRRRVWIALGVTALVATALSLAIALGTGGSGAPKPRPAAVQPIPRGATAQQQARNVAAWLRRYSR